MHQAVPSKKGVGSGMGLPAGEAVPAAAWLRRALPLLLQLQEVVLLVAGRLQHLLQGGVLPHGLGGDLPALHRVRRPVPLAHRRRQRGVDPAGGHAAVGRAVAVVAVRPGPGSRLAAVALEGAVPRLQEGARLALRGGGLGHAAELGQGRHGAHGGVEGAVCGPRRLSPSAAAANTADTPAPTPTPTILRGLVVSQGVDLAGVGGPGLPFPGWRDPQAAKFGPPGDGGPHEGVLRRHGLRAGPGQRLRVKHDLRVQGAGGPAPCAASVRLDGGSEPELWDGSQPCTGLNPNV